MSKMTGRETAAGGKDPPSSYTVTTTPPPTDGFGGAPLRSDLGAAAPPTTNQLEDAYKEAIKQLEKTISDIKGTAAASPKLSIEGIALSTGTSPVMTVAESKQVVNIIERSTDDFIKRSITANAIGPRPVIMSAMKFPRLSSREMDDAIEVNQFERQFVKEMLVKGVGAIIQADPRQKATAANNESKKSSITAEDQVNAISYMQSAASTAATGLDITAISDQIMQRASDAMKEIFVASETSNAALPKSIDDYIFLTYPLPDIQSKFTNTSRVVTVAQDMFASALSVHPTLLRRFSRGNIGANSSNLLFSPEGRFQYDIDGTGPSAGFDIPAVSRVFLQNVAQNTIVSSFVPGTSASRSGRTAALPLLDANSRASSISLCDAVSHIISCISNEMIISAGIGRLRGSQLGTRFLELSRDTNQYKPFTRVFGCDPLSGPAEVGKFFTSGPDRRGSLLDFLALGEENNSGVVVMPLETNSVLAGNKVYASGKSYFIDLAIKNTGVSGKAQRQSLRNFSTDYSKYTADMSAYMTEILALTEETPLSPQLLSARVLQDFLSVVKEMNESPDTQDKKSVAVASLFVYAFENDQPITNNYDDERLVQKITGGASGTGEFADPSIMRAARSRGIIAKITDILKMSVIVALRDLDKLTTDVTFSLSNKNTNYDDNTDGISALLNPSFQLKYSVLNMIRNESLFNGVKQATDRETIYSHKEDETLYDREFSTKSNLINLIARTIREVQKEAYNLAQRNGSSTEYRNSENGTLLSNCDEDRLIDIFVDLYLRLAYLLIKTGTYKTMKQKGTPPGFTVFYDVQKTRLTEQLLISIINSLIGGSEINSDAIFNELGTRASDLLGKSSRVDDIIKTFSSITNHRYYIKASLKILESISAGVTATSAKISGIFDILDASVRRETLKDQDLVLYDLFVTNNARNSSLRAMFSEQQVNLCAMSRYHFVSNDPVFLRRDLDVTRSERLAVRDFIRSIYDKGSVDDLQLLSVALPAGTIESLYRPTISTQKSDVNRSSGTEGMLRGKNLRIEIDRYERVYRSTRPALQEAQLLEVDPEIYLLPDSIAYDPDKRSSPEAVDAIYDTTTFYRIRNGNVTDRIVGSSAPPSLRITLMNALKSYLLDLYLYETIKIRYLDGTAAYGPATLSSAGYDLMREVSSSTELSKLIMTAPRFDVIFDSNRRIKEGIDLAQLLIQTRDVDTSPYKIYPLDVAFISTAASIVPLCDMSPVVMPRSYERIYNFLYDENVVRGRNFTSNAPARREFDIYSLSARVTYGTNA